MVSPIPDHAFFEKPVFQHLLGQRFLQIARLGTQGFDLIGGRLAGRVASETLLAGLKEFL